VFEECAHLGCNAVQFEERARRFGGTYRLHLQGRRICQARNQQKQAECGAQRSASLFLLNVGLSQKFQGITNQKAVLFLITVVTTSIPAYSGLVFRMLLAYSDVD
jgi:hypothetical protein